jgi:hypothetical protein
MDDEEEEEEEMGASEIFYSVQNGISDSAHYVN